MTHFDLKNVKGYDTRKYSNRVLVCTWLHWFMLSCVPISRYEHFISQDMLFQLGSRHYYSQITYWRQNLLNPVGLEESSREADDHYTQEYKVGCV